MCRAVEFFNIDQTKRRRILTDPTSRNDWGVSFLTYKLYRIATDTVSVMA